MSSESALTQGLTESQREAVEHFEGPLLVLAGPGSGKTRVITRRIARLIERGVDPRRILAITFTNKAAGEMAERTAEMLSCRPPWISTFHRFCSRLLRTHADLARIQSNFTIYDASDQRQLLKKVLDDVGVDPIHYPPRKLAARISEAKNELLTPKRFAEIYGDRVGNDFEVVAARVYPAYQSALASANALDFDDLLLYAVRMLENEYNQELRADLDARWQFVLVDEYQDTNTPQYRLVRALSRDFPNLCVTGDPDQSVYGWRGARIENILRFEADYQSAVVVRLEQNFRSTPEILEAADRLIGHNTNRKAKGLVTDKPEGESVEMHVFEDAVHEADVIARTISEAVESGERNRSDFAIVYRVNSLSRRLERALVQHRVPFQVAAGVAFYDRAEVKDTLAYLRLVNNPADLVSFQRIVNTPRRGVGKTTLQRVINHVDRNGITPLDACRNASKIESLSSRPQKAIERFAAMIDDFRDCAAGPVGELLQMILDRTDYTAEWRASESEDAVQRLSNVDELLSAARRHDATHEEPSLESFLEECSLVSDVDDLEEGSDRVTLMTMHAAKGLEFPVVYVVGVEENLIPHERSLNSKDPRQLEEERRLLFVAMTRAMQRLVLTRTVQREIHGRTLLSIPSSFLSEFAYVEKSHFRGDDFDQNEEYAPQYSPEAPPLQWGGLEPPTAHPKHQRSPTPTPTPTPNGPALTTGANLMNGTNTAAEIPRGFAVGMTVRHPREGLGTVVDVGGMGKRRTVTVAFNNDNTKTFIQSACPLQPVGTG